MDPTLAWVGLPYRVSPWPTAAGQAAVLGRLWSGNLSLEEIEASDLEMERELQMGLNGGTPEWERVVRELAGPGREEGAWTHLLPPPRDSMFMDRLAELCKLADGRDAGGGDVEKRSWVGEYDVWSVYLKRVRERLGELREGYSKAAAEGRTVRGLEEVGLGWEEVMGGAKGVEGDGAAI